VKFVRDLGRASVDIFLLLDLVGTRTTEGNKFGP